MTHAIQLNVELPGDLALFRLPVGVHARLQQLLDRQQAGEVLSQAEVQEAEGLVDMADMLSLLRMRSERLGSK